MYLKELRINGFKSFANATSIDLEPGVTAVVGPNGCGKSNIADAIRWVLGEQSAKSLRAGNMQDVIFQGTDARKPVNLCEVSLLFSDCEADLGTAYHEVQVARQVTRDGSSSYLLNGKACRLKDIQRLFLDTGVGQVSYSFMVQGQIDQILSTNPAERRTIFEEAAGISKYKAQRREALNKLNLVDANLARVTDVIEEVTRQIGSLKRQATKALRYKRIKHRLTHLDLALGAKRFAELSGSIGGVEKEASAIREKAETLQKELEKQEGALATKRESRSELYEKMQEAQQTVFDLRSEKEQAESQAEFAGIRSDDLKNRIEEIKKDLAEIESQKKSLADRAAQNSQSKEEQLDLFGNSDEVFKKHNEDLMRAQAALSEAENDLQQRKQELLMTESNITRLRSNCTTLEVDLKTYQVRHANLSEEIFRLKSDSEEEEKNLKEILNALAKREKDRKKEEDALQKLQEKTAGLQGDFRALQTEIQEVDRGIAQQAAQMGVLESLQQKLEGFSEGAKAILQGKLEKVLDKGSYRLLTKSLKIESGYTEAFVGLLGPAVDAIVLKDASKAVDVAAQLEADKLGRACLQIEADPVKTGKKGKLPDWLVPAGDVVAAKEEEIGGLLSNLLSGCYFCDNLGEFLSYWRENPGFDFLFAATRSGELVDRRGLVYGGHKSGETDTYLQREAEIKKLRREIEKAEKKLDGFREKADKVQGQLEQSESAVEEKRKQLVEIAQEHSTALEQERSARQKLEENTTRSAQLAKDLEALEKNRDESLQRLETAQKQLADVEAEIESQRKAIGESEKQIEKLRQERDVRREGLSEVRLELAEKRQRLELIDRSLDEIEKQSGELSQLSIKRSQEIDSQHEQIAELEKEAKEQKEKAAQIDKTLKVTMESLEKDRKILMGAEAEIKDLEKSLSALREESREAETGLNKFEVQMARQRSEFDFMIEEFRREYDVEIKSVDWKQELWLAGDELQKRVRLDLDDDEALENDEDFDRGEPTEEDLRALDDTDWEGVKEEVEALRGRINAMGPVNLVAIEEYRELRERYEFLKTQSDDLWKSKDQLLAAIDDINQTSQQLFQETFEQIRKNFAYTFESLFGGGLADLELIDNEDVLESGIDITARPPGTRLKTLALLSGGQKTMTAVALLFAIYMVKPSPFCLLDELDAPLDDANIGRFVKMLKQFTRYSQFIIITHNKRTIAAANSIYGVTMQEKGVSKLVSMRFDSETGQAQELEEAGLGI